MSKKRVGVFICHCGGNISDYVNVDEVREKIEKDQDVVVAKTTMFACSDAAQQEMIDAISEEKLEGLVVASCSPKLHLFTFRSVASRAGLNPYQYVQVNLREQCSWAHRGAKEEATLKGFRLVEAGIAKTKLTEPLEKLRIETEPAVLVVGAGVSGLRAALALSDLRLSVYLVEKSERVGGWIERWKKMFPHDREGRALVSELVEKVRSRENITLFTNAEVVDKSGTVGDLTVTVEARGEDRIRLNVGAIIVATGFEPYQPKEGEFGYGLEGVVTLPEFKRLLDDSSDELLYNGRRVRTIVYIYCVGSRQEESEEEPEPNRYCSRYCCSAAVHSAAGVNEVSPEINQYHLFRDMRSYGKQELLYEDVSRKGSVFIRFDGEEPPSVTNEEGRLHVSVKDMLIGGEEVDIEPDLVVLVTGMVPGDNQSLTNVLKIPVGRDGFYNEIHPKLRPVETVIDGIFIVGCAQGPKNLSESVASALSGVSKVAAMLLKGYVDLEPFVARIDQDACTWCDECMAACPYGAIEKVEHEGRVVARVIEAQCKGGGACVPVCPKSAIDLAGYTDAQIKAMIEALAREAV